MKSAIIIFLCIGAATADIPVHPVALDESQDKDVFDVEIVTPGQFPFQVANVFSLPFTRGLCGGALICDSWVLTAAHCAKNATLFALYLGSVDLLENDGVIMQSRDAIIHEKYDENNYNYDIALIRLPEKVVFTDNIQPIALSRSSLEENVDLVICGWGSRLKPSSLYSIDVKSITNEECKKTYHPKYIPSTTVCAAASEDRKPCHGDSGSPLIRKRVDGSYEQVGVSSYVSTAGCSKGHPSGYIRTAELRDWVEEQVGDTCELLD